MKLTQLFKFISILFVSLLVSSCNKEEQSSGGNSNNNNSNNNPPASGTAILKLYIGGTWKSYDLSGDTHIDKSDCFGSWSEFVGFGTWDAVEFDFGLTTAANGQYNYAENSSELCDPEVEIYSFDDILADLQNHYGVPVYQIIDTNGDGQFTVSNLSSNQVSVNWSGNVTIRSSTYYDVLAVIPATFTATNEPYEDWR